MWRDEYLGLKQSIFLKNPLWATDEDFYFSGVDKLGLWF